MKLARCTTSRPTSGTTREVGGHASRHGRHGRHSPRLVISESYTRESTQRDLETAVHTLNDIPQKPLERLKLRTECWPSRCCYCHGADGSGLWIEVVKLTASAAMLPIASRQGAAPRAACRLWSIATVPRPCLHSSITSLSEPTSVLRTVTREEEGSPYHLTVVDVGVRCLGGGGLGKLGG